MAVPTNALAFKNWKEHTGSDDIKAIKASSAGLQGWANLKRSQEAATLTDPSGVAQPVAEAADPAAQDLTSAATVPAVTAAPVAAEPP